MEFSNRVMPEPHGQMYSPLLWAKILSFILPIGTGGIWRSTDFGTNWTLINSDPSYGVQGWYSHFIAVNPTDETQLVHGVVGIGKSTNGGTSFFGSSGSYSDHHAYAHHPTNPNILYVANDDGIYRSTDFGSS